jgi:hypothetical protein
MIGPSDAALPTQAFSKRTAAYGGVNAQQPHNSEVAEDKTLG